MASPNRASYPNNNNVAYSAPPPVYINNGTNPNGLFITPLPTTQTEEYLHDLKSARLLGIVEIALGIIVTALFWMVYYWPILLGLGAIGTGFWMFLQFRSEESASHSDCCETAATASYRLWVMHIAMIVFSICGVATGILVLAIIHDFWAIYWVMIVIFTCACLALVIVSWVGMKCVRRIYDALAPIEEALSPRAVVIEENPVQALPQQTTATTTAVPVRDTTAASQPYGHEESRA